MNDALSANSRDEGVRIDFDSRTGLDDITIADVAMFRMEWMRKGLVWADRPVELMTRDELESAVKYSIVMAEILLERSADALREAEALLHDANRTE